MNLRDSQKLAKFAYEIAAHECGHMVVLFTADRLDALNFYPHETAFDGSKGVVQTDAKSAIGKEDCAALAGSLVAELICFGSCDSPRLDDDRQLIQRIAGHPLENFALSAYEVIKQNIVFFGLLRIEVQKTLFAVLHEAFWAKCYAALPIKMPVISLAEVKQVHKRAESTLAGFPRKT